MTRIPCIGRRGPMPRVVAARAPWQPGDARGLEDFVVIGRAKVAFVDVDLTLPGLLLASRDPRTLGHRVVAFFDPVTRDLVLLDEDAPGAG